MRFRIAFSLLLLIPLALLALFNLDALREPFPLNLGLTRIEAPLWPLLLALPVVLLVIFLGAALIDRARHGRQLMQLERALESARRDLDRGREAAFEALSSEMQSRIEGLESALSGSVSGLEQRLGARVDEVDAHVVRAHDEQREALDGLSARVGSVRQQLLDELAEAHAAFLRELPPQLGSGEGDHVLPHPADDART